MNDASAAPPQTARRVRPRDAASLILLRGEGRDLEVLVGRRSLKARFMPGVYVFPGGAIDLADRAGWSVESGAEMFPPRLASAARAAIRETWEEVGVLIAPSLSFRRFNTRFFLGDAEAVVGEPTASPELEDAGWHRVDAALVDGFRDVTRFMLERAIALRDGRAAGPPPLFYTVGAARRIGICREAKR